MTANIIKAVNAVMKQVGYVRKGGENKFHGYKYAGEADLLEKLRPAIVEAGLILLPSVTEQSAPDEFGNTRVRVEYTLAHVSGEVWPTPIVAQGCGNDKNSKGGIGDKGCYKAITGANKYLLFKLFQIETGDDPEVAEAPPPPDTGRRDAYMKLARDIIEVAMAKQNLRDWWKAEAQARRDAGLNQADVKALTDAMAKKAEGLPDEPNTLLGAA